MTPAVLAATGGALVAAAISAVSVTLVLLGRLRRQRRLERRLRGVAAPLTGTPAAPVSDLEDMSILRSQKKRFPFWNAVETRYPLVYAPTVIPRVLGLGVLGGAAAVGVLWFLRIPFGWWTAPIVGTAGVAVTWAALSWFQKRLLKEFVAKFPDSVDHIVRLSTTGLPVLGAVASIIEHAPHPVKPVLAMFNDQLQAGISPDDAARAVSERYRIPELTIFMAVVRLQRRSGSSVSAAFANLSRALRERHQSGLKANASTAQTRFTLVVLAILPALLLVAQTQLSPTSIDMLFNTDSGLQLLRWGFVLIVAGIWLARTIASRATR